MSATYLHDEYADGNNLQLLKKFDKKIYLEEFISIDLKNKL